MKEMHLVEQMLYSVVIYCNGPMFNAASNIAVL